MKTYRSSVSTYINQTALMERILSSFYCLRSVCHVLLKDFPLEVI